MGRAEGLGEETGAADSPRATGLGEEVGAEVPVDVGRAAGRELVSGARLVDAFDVERVGEDFETSAIVALYVRRYEKSFNNPLQMLPSC